MLINPICFFSGPNGDGGGKIQWKTDKNEITRLLFGIEIESKLGFQKQQTKYFSKFVQICLSLI